MTDEEFVKRWELWNLAVGPKDPNSLVQQMQQICWGIAFYEALRASWKTETETDGDTFVLNRILFHFITDNFVRSMFTDLRRLTENEVLEEPNPARNDRSVFSLESLLADVRENRREYTRRRRFLALKEEYDVEAIEKRRQDYIMRHTGFISMPADLNPLVSRNIHTDWDRCCCCAATRRTENDVIDEQYLWMLSEEVQKIRGLVAPIVNKRYGHAATPPSRGSLQNAEPVSLVDLINLTVRAGEIVNTLCSIISTGIYPFLANVLWDKWEHWEHGWKASRDVLDAAWNDWEGRVARLQPIWPAGSVT